MSTAARRQSSARVPAEGSLRRAGTFLAAFGVGVAAYIAIAEADGGAPACLAGGGGCEKIAASSHSELLGVSVAVIGIAGYALLLATALLRGDAARMGGFLLGLIGLGYSVYLTYLELFVIEAVCQWCLVSAVLMTALFAVNALRMVTYVGRPA
ncbi:MAG TPA: vitamin K epoxide reductase family protein [Solirubrobacterales bacterium]|nr:vitamin K epoxide reductase family protein [Solirubrobacterales bacterium]